MMSTTGTGSSNSSPTAMGTNYVISPEMLYRIPGRDAKRGEITHKTLRQMNRHERRLVRSARGRKLGYDQ